MSFLPGFSLTYSINRTKNLLKYIAGISRRGRRDRYSRDEVIDSIVLVHLGVRDIPSYVIDCVEQIRLFSDIPVYFVCGRKKVVDGRLAGLCSIVHYEDLPLSPAHLDFYKKMSSGKAVFDNFFQCALERFFVLDEAISGLGLKNVIHMENDILLYEDPVKILRMLEIDYKNVTVPRMNEKDSMASVMYIPDKDSLSDFLAYINGHIYDKGCNDMNLLAAYMREKRLLSLPVIYEGYPEKYELKNQKGDRAPAEYESDYYLHAGEYGGIFDAAPIGQFIGGTDKKPGGVTENVGFINDAAFIDPSKLDIRWKKEKEGYIPFVIDKDKTYRIFNLHVHCKELYKYRSDRYEEV